MTISNNGQQYQNTGKTRVVDLHKMKGTGRTGFSENITGILTSITIRDDYYEWTNEKTGELIRKPQTAIAKFDNGQFFNWPTYEDENGVIQAWDKFDEDINLGDLMDQGIAIHVWKDARRFTHLEVVGGQQTAAQSQPQMQQPQPQPQMQPQPQQYYPQQYYQQPQPQQYYQQQMNPQPMPGQPMPW